MIHNLESQKLQYAMEERLHQLGWHEMEVVDDDLGRSAAGLVTRAGFERMVAEVCLGKVGAVAAREVSRFARNSHEWQQRVEVCRVVDTVLIDQEMVYAPRLSNDRLLLDLKGSLNEYELDLLRQRSVEARREKARRGELLQTAPVGDIKTEDQRLEKYFFPDVFDLSSEYWGDSSGADRSSRRFFREEFQCLVAPQENSCGCIHNESSGRRAGCGSEMDRVLPDRICREVGGRITTDLNRVGVRSGRSRNICCRNHIDGTAILVLFLHAIRIDTGKVGEKKRCYWL